MKYTVIAAFAAGASAAVYGTPSNGTAPSYVTEVVTAYTTYCPEATQLTHGGKTYTVTEATTLTITDCPCTVSYPVVTKTTSSCTTTPAPITTGSTPSGTGYPSHGNGTVPTYTSPTYVNVSPTATYAGAANQVVGQAGAGFAALMGVVAYLL